MNTATKLHGVNLGGWLVIERWITPSLFEGTRAQDEWSFVQTPGAKKRLEHHWQTFIQGDDIAWLHEHGINALRIPVGYWIFGEKPYFAAIKHLDQAMNWAKKYDMHVIICLHGAPGSQNGEHHSGRAGEAKWYTNPSYREKTLQILNQLTDRYIQHPAFWGIELLNEPRKLLFQRTLRQFYRNAYSDLVAKMKVIFSDAFMPRRMSGALPNLAYMDIHWYHFGWRFHALFPISWYETLVDSRLKLIRRLQRKNPIIIGEWSMVLSHQALEKYPEQDRMDIMCEFAKRQLKSYSTADGWFYWTYKTEEQGPWNFRWLVEAGKINLPNF